MDHIDRMDRWTNERISEWTDGPMNGRPSVSEPKRPRNCINFSSASRSTARAGPAKRLSIFEHVDGCAVCAGLYGHFRLPNGGGGDDFHSLCLSLGFYMHPSPQHVF